MERYKTLGDRCFEINQLTDREQKAYKEIQSVLKQKPEPHWGGEFPNFWHEQLIRVYGSENALVDTALWEICQDMEARLGVKQGYLEPDEGYDWLGNLGIADNGKLLFVFASVAHHKLPGILDSRIHTYIALLDKFRVVSFIYHFRDRPEPYSVTLADDLFGFINSRFLRLTVNTGYSLNMENIPQQHERDPQATFLYASIENMVEDKVVNLHEERRCSIDTEGLLWLEKSVPHAPPYDDWLRNRIARKIEEFNGWSETELLQAVYQEVAPV